MPSGLSLFGLSDRRASLGEFESEAFELLARTNISNADQTDARHIIGHEPCAVANIVSVQAASARPDIASGTFDTLLNAVFGTHSEFSEKRAGSAPTGRWGESSECVRAVCL